MDVGRSIYAVETTPAVLLSAIESECTRDGTFMNREQRDLVNDGARIGIDNDCNSSLNAR